VNLAVILDENVPPAISDYLGLQTAIVITFDEDFGDTRMCPVGSHAGVIRLRV
jgi:hypothetical protein